MWTPPPGAALLYLAAAAPSDSSGPSSTQFLIAQFVTLTVALVAAVAAIRGKRTDRATKGDEILDQRRARIEQGIEAELVRKNEEIARLDRELEEAYAEVGKLRKENHLQWRDLRRYARELDRLGVDVDDLTDDGSKP